MFGCAIVEVFVGLGMMHSCFVMLSVLASRLTSSFSSGVTLMRWSCFSFVSRWDRVSEHISLRHFECVCYFFLHDREEVCVSEHDVRCLVV